MSIVRLIFTQKMVHNIPNSRMQEKMQTFEQQYKCLTGRNQDFFFFLLRTPKAPKWGRAREGCPLLMGGGGSGGLPRENFSI